MPGKADDRGSGRVTWRQAPSTSRTTRRAKSPDGATLRFQDLRHTGALLAASPGATLTELMGSLDHSTSQAAMRYPHAAQDRGKVIVEAKSALAANS